MVTVQVQLPEETFSAASSVSRRNGRRSASSSAKYCEDSDSPTERPGAPRHPRCLTKGNVSNVEKLATLAANAVRNADLHRALELLEEIRVICEGAPVNLQAVR